MVWPRNCDGAAHTMKIACFSFLGVAAAVCLATSAAAQTPAAWQQPVNVAASAGSLNKISGCNLCPDAGAYSGARLTNDGYMEFVPASGHRLSAGLTSEAVPGIAGTLVDYAFSIWPTGVYEIRERGVYRGEGPFAAGDRFRIGFESGRIVYRRNGTVVHTSTLAPAAPLALSVTLSTTGSSIQNAVLYLGTESTAAAGGGEVVPLPIIAPAPPPPPSPQPPPGVVSVGPYMAIVERQVHAKPALPAMGLAGSSIVDPVFGSRITRITDGRTRPGLPNRSFRSPSSPHQNAWSAAGTYFYVVSTDGTSLPFTFNPATGTATRVQATSTGEGGLIFDFYMEPQFSFVNDAQIYGSSSAAPRAVAQYDFNTRTYTRILDMDTVVPGLGNTYMGGIASSAGTRERIVAFFGGTMQDQHHYAVVFDKDNPQQRLVLETRSSTLNGAATSIPLNFSLHHVAMDRSGRYVMLYPTWVDLALPRKAAQSYLWDTETGTFTPLDVAALPYGHDAFGYGVSVNQDCCVATTWDAAQWQFRTLATPLKTRDIITNVLLPKEIYLGEHSTWNNARPDRLVPFISALYHEPTSETPQRAWDDEIVAIQTDAPGTDATVWRFAHHRTDVRNDVDPTSESFWYQPHPNVSPDGRWVLFTSNWEKTLGTDPVGDPSTTARQDAFIVELRPSSAAPQTPPPGPQPAPTSVPVSIGATTVPSGQVGVAYSVTLSAAGGSGAYTWKIAGALPAGLSLDAASGSVSGVPTAGGSYAVTLTVADAADPANAASAAYTIPIAPATTPTATVDIVSPRLLPNATVGVAYSYTVLATNVRGTPKWDLAGGALPPGMKLDPVTGVISGTCLKIGRFNFNARITDSASSDTLTLTIRVQ